VVLQLPPYSVKEREQKTVTRSTSPVRRVLFFSSLPLLRGRLGRGSLNFIAKVTAK